MDDLPFVTKPAAMLGIFVVEVLVLHLFLVRREPSSRLSKKSWAIVQYVIIALGFSGLLGAVSTARKLIAQDFVKYTNDTPSQFFAHARSMIDQGSTEGSICRTFVRSDSSPPPEQFDRAQHEIDAVCSWYKQLAKSFPTTAPSDSGQIPWSTLPPPPSVTQPQLVEEVGRVRQQLENYNYVAQRHARFEEAARTTTADSIVAALAPILISFALALQVTKVTGETWFPKGP
jgi:hypothetical protein